MQNHAHKRRRQGDGEQSTYEEIKWVQGEDDFVLKQARKRAEIRVNNGRGKPIDLLALNLRIVDNCDDEIYEGNEDGVEVELIEPFALIESLDQASMPLLLKEIETYISLERVRGNIEFWEAALILVREKEASNADSIRKLSAVSGDVDRLMGNKNAKQLEGLRDQIRSKLVTGQAIDVDYWEAVLRKIDSARAKRILKELHGLVLNSRLEQLRRHQILTSRGLIAGLKRILDSEEAIEESKISYKSPEPQVLDLNSKIPTMTLVDYMQSLSRERQSVRKKGFVPLNTIVSEAEETETVDPVKVNADYAREIAKGEAGDEEPFNVEYSLPAQDPSLKVPLYYNRVQVGIEWNRYTAVHYDEKNPPPPIVTGYHFNIFYPDLVGTSQSPKYKVEREGGRKRGQSVATSGEQDTCILRFTCSGVYQDIAFLIVDNEWDYSSKYERGFRSSFEKGVFRLHFKFKKVFISHSSLLKSVILQKIVREKFVMQVAVFALAQCPRNLLGSPWGEPVVMACS